MSDEDKGEAMLRRLAGDNLNDATLRLLLGMAVLAFVLGTLAWIIR